MGLHGHDSGQVKYSDKKPQLTSLQVVVQQLLKVFG